MTAVSRPTLIQISNTFGGFEFSVKIEGSKANMKPESLAKLKKVFRSSLYDMSTVKFGEFLAPVKTMIQYFADAFCDTARSDCAVFNSESGVLDSGCPNISEASKQTGLSLTPGSVRAKLKID